jgi:murein tripeptide amidase MpaA
MNVNEIASAVNGLVNEYSISTFSPPDPTAEGSSTVGGVVGGSFSGDCHIYFTAGVHARERGGPDNLIYFISDLLYAQKNGTGLNYGAKSYTNDQVLRVLSIGIAFIPLVNPDGVRYDQATDSVWRKNRNPASAIPNDDNSIGVDINRNYDFLWDFKYFATGVQPASGNPDDGTFHGQFAFSESESRNVAWVFDRFSSIRWYVDIHSFAAAMYYSWGDDDDQVTNSSQNFRNSNFDGQRGILGAADYMEYIDTNDLATFQAVTDRVTSAMNAVAGNSYSPHQATGAGTTSGIGSDYSYSRFQVDGSKNKVYGFSLEFGTRKHFYPSLAEFQVNLLDTCAGLMEFCLAAADIGIV